MKPQLVLCYFCILFLNLTNAYQFSRGVNVNVGGGEMEVEGLDMDSDHNSIIIGACFGEVTFQSHSGSYKSDSTNDYQPYVASYDSKFNLNWYHIIDTDYGYANWVVTDSSNHVTILGYFQGSLSLSSASYTSNSSSEDVFVIQYDQHGNERWHFVFGGTGNDENGPLAVGSDDSIYMASYVNGVVNVGGSLYGEDGVVSWLFCKLVSGSPSWCTSYPAGSYVVGMAYDSTTNSIIGVGTHSNSFTLGTTTLPARSFSLVLKLSAVDGSYIWHSEFGDEANNLGGSMRDVVVDSSGYVYVGGVANGNVTVGNITVTGNNDLDAFLVKYTPDGVPVWAMKSESAGAQFFSQMDLGVNNTLFVCGQSEYTSGQTTAPYDFTGLFIAMFDTDTGDYIDYFPGVTSDGECYGIVAEDNEDTFTWASYYQQSIEFTGNTTYDTPNYGAFVVRFADSVDNSPDPSSASHLQGFLFILVVLLVTLL